MGEINILVLGVGGNVSQGILTAIRHSKGTCVSSDSLGGYM
jgi:hypothetical protein